MTPLSVLVVLLVVEKESFSEQGAEWGTEKATVLGNTMAALRQVEGSEGGVRRRLWSLPLASRSERGGR